MCISDRSNIPTMRILLYSIISFCAFCFMSCHEEKVVDPTDAPKETLLSALEALNAGDYDSYLKNVDMGEDMDTFHVFFMKQVLKQHHEWIVQEKDSISSVQIVDVKMKNDSLATVYYQYVFGDSTTEVSSQKMMRIDGAWKLRLRN